MKKLITVAATALVLACTAQSEFKWSWWLGAPDLSGESVRGCVLGLASEVGTVTGAQVDLLWHKAKKVTSGAQVAFGYSRVDSLRNGCQAAVVNSADSAALQLGLICVNKSGFLPWFVFFNFDPKQFGAAK
ncbi:MAG: hypothetical protein ACI4RA_00800 [Kiritimatiellia bacterium]